MMQPPRFGASYFFRSDNGQVEAQIKKYFGQSPDIGIPFERPMTFPSMPKGVFMVNTHKPSSRFVRMVHWCVDTFIGPELAGDPIAGALKALKIPFVKSESTLTTDNAVQRFLSAPTNLECLRTLPKRVFPTLAQT